MGCVDRLKVGEANQSTIRAKDLHKPNPRKSQANMDLNEASNFIHAKSSHRSWFVKPGILIGFSNNFNVTLRQDSVTASIIRF